MTRFLEKGFNVVGNSGAISDSTHLTPSPQLALVDGDIADSATAQKITDTAYRASYNLIELHELPSNGQQKAVPNANRNNIYVESLVHYR